MDSALRPMSTSEVLDRTFHLYRTQIWEYIGSFMAGVAAGPISTIAIALLYYDQRVRKEAFDLQFLMESLDGFQHHMKAASAN
jgi:hypothetical protein